MPDVLNAPPGLIAPKPMVSSAQYVVFKTVVLGYFDLVFWELLRLMILKYRVSSEGFPLGLETMREYPPSASNESMVMEPLMKAGSKELVSLTKVSNATTTYLVRKESVAL